MSNDLNGNPLYFDSTGAVSNQMLIQAIMWVSDEGGGDDINAADDFKITDGSGNPVCGKQAKFAGDDFYIPFPLGYECNGLIVSKLDGGVCYVYLKDIVA